MGCLPHHDAQRAGDRHAHDHGGDPQHHAQLLFPDAQVQVLELFVQVMFLQVDQRGLLLQEGIRVFPAGAAQGQGRSDGIDAGERRFPAGFRPFLFLRHSGPHSLIS